MNMIDSSDTILNLPIPATDREVIIRLLLLHLLHPHHFYVANGLALTWQTPAEKEEYWELFHGNILPINQSRETVRFLSAGTFETTPTGLADEPLVAVKWDNQQGVVHVVRAILSHVWEGVATAGNVIESRETIRWTRELVGSVVVSEYATVGDLLRELTCLVFHAVVGTSRLPLTSLETPLPQFALGRFGYFYDISFAGAGTADALAQEWRNPKPMQSWQGLIARMQEYQLTDTVAARMLELCCRSLAESEVTGAAEFCKQNSTFDATRIILLFRRMFNDLSLSPVTEFVERALRLLHRMQEAEMVSAEQRLDLLGYQLRWLCRHLTAYDLVTFHNRGANYPDALFLDALLLEICSAFHANADLVLSRAGDDVTAQSKKRRRRRAFRQACIIRRRYQDHAVPDAPTSPGENTRVLPEPFIRVPEEQILNVQKRTRRLFAGDELPHYLDHHLKSVLKQSTDDLALTDEQQEMGTAVFIDRPLGIGKHPAEPDQTILFAYEAFSKHIARQRLSELQQLASEVGITMPSDLAASFDELKVDGLPIHEVHSVQRPPASLADVVRVSADFVLIRTLPRGIREFCRHYVSESATAIPNLEECVLIVPSHCKGKPCLALYDSAYKRRCDLEILLDLGYYKRCGIERPAGGLRAM